MTWSEAKAQLRLLTGYTYLDTTDKTLETFLKAAYLSVAKLLSDLLPLGGAKFVTTVYPAGSKSIEVYGDDNLAFLLLFHVGIASDDGLTTVETLTPADMRDFGPLFERDFRSGTASRFRWRYTVPLLAIYPPPEYTLTIRVGGIVFKGVPSGDNEILFSEFPLGIAELAADVVVKQAARNMRMCRLGDAAAFEVLYQEAKQALEVACKGQNQQPEHIPSVMWRDG